MSFKEKIDGYGREIQDLETSPFETMDTFHLRTELHAHYNEMSKEEKDLLKQNDTILHDMAGKVYEHVKKVYDFKNDKPLEEWWWHLDQVVANHLIIDVDKGIVKKPFLSTTVDFASREGYERFLDWSRDKQIVIREPYGGDYGQT